MLFKRAESEFWYVRYRDAGGKRVKRSTGTTDRREAEELEAKWRLEAREQRLWGTQPQRTFDELMLRYLKETKTIKRSAETDAWYAKALTAYFSGRVLSKLKRADVRGYITRRKSDGVKGGTINREIGLLSSAINRARVEWDWDIPNPVQGMREPEGEGRRVFLSQEQFNALVAAAGMNKRAPYLADLITVAVMTGCRRGELLGLEWSRVDLQANTIRLGAADTKAGKARLVAINQAAREALLRRKAYREKHCPDATWVFCGRRVKRIAGIKTSFHAMCRAAGLVGVRFHDLRHTCGSWLAQAGVPQSHIAEVLGHSTLRMTERYMHIAPATARAAVEKLEGVPKQVPTQATEEVAAL